MPAVHYYNYVMLLQVAFLLRQALAVFSKTDGFDCRSPRPPLALSIV